MRSLARAVWYTAVRAVNAYTEMAVRCPAIAWVTEGAIVLSLILAMIWVSR